MADLLPLGQGSSHKDTTENSPLYWWSPVYSPWQQKADGTIRAASLLQMTPGLPLKTISAYGPRKRMMPTDPW